MQTSSVVSMDVNHLRTRYTNASGTVFDFLEHDYSSTERVILSATELRGHCYPGSSDPGTEQGQLFSFACEQSSAFAWGEAAVQFFIDHPKD